MGIKGLGYLSFVLSFITSTQLHGGRLLDEMRNARKQERVLERKRLIHGDNYGRSHAEIRTIERRKERERERREFFNPPPSRTPAHLESSLKFWERVERERKERWDADRKKFFERFRGSSKEDTPFESVVPLSENINGSRATMIVDQKNRVYVVKLKIKIFGAGLFSKFKASEYRSDFSLDEQLKAKIFNAVEAAINYFNKSPHTRFEVVLDYGNDSELISSNSPRDLDYKSYRSLLLDGIKKFQLENEALPLIIEPTPTKEPRTNLPIGKNEALTWSLSSHPITLAQTIFRPFGFLASPDRDSQYPVNWLMGAPLEILLFEYFSQEKATLRLEEFHYAMLELSKKWGPQYGFDPSELDAVVEPRYRPREDIENLEKLNKRERIRIATARLKRHPELRKKVSQKKCLAAIKKLAETFSQQSKG